LEVKQTTFDAVVERTSDEMLKKQLQQDKEYFEANMKVMTQMMENQTKMIETLANQNRQAIHQPPPVIMQSP